jgi:hypothetical protein
MLLHCNRLLLIDVGSLHGLHDRKPNAKVAKYAVLLLLLICARRFRKILPRLSSRPLSTHPC